MKKHIAFAARLFSRGQKSPAAPKPEAGALPQELRGRVFSSDCAEPDDDILAAAKKIFGVPYLFPWQRLVIGNILDAASDLAASGGGLSGPEKQSSPRASGSRDKSAARLDSGGEGLQNGAGFSSVFDGAGSSKSDASDMTDVFCMGRQIVLLPTGAGKSLCFLLPALLLSGPTLIFYPLLALMSDQKRRLEQAGIECAVFRGGQSQEERDENFLRIKNGVKIILANPEVLQSAPLVERLKACDISHVAIDEAHCVSEWGDSFRPAYLTLGKIISDLGVGLVTAFTATASPAVLERVSQVLFGGRVHIARGESDRPNIHYSVQMAWAKKRAACRLALAEQKPMLIFCGTRAKSEDMARELSECVGRDKVRFYHAGLSREEKAAVEKWFFPKSDAILCCTCAFGMGVDKADIRTVVHLEPSPSAESYIQEAGRGGRDKKPSKAILLWSKNDSFNYENFPPASRESAMRKFAQSETCRRQILLDALGGEKTICSGCDICDAKKSAAFPPLQKSARFSLAKKVAAFSPRRFARFWSAKKSAGGSAFPGGRFGALRNSARADWKAPSVFDAEDARLVHSLVRKNQNFLGENQIVALALQKLNERDRALFGTNVWDAGDIKEILEQLKKSGSVYNAGFLWKGNLAARKNMFSPPRRHPLCLRPRRLLARLPSWARRPLALFSLLGAAAF